MGCLQSKCRQENQSDWVKIDQHVSFDRTRTLGGSKRIFHGRVKNIGEGTFDVAVKFINKDDKTVREPDNLQRLGHPNVVKLYRYGDYKFQGYDFYFAMEICEKSLYDLMEENPEECQRNWIIILDVIKGLKHTHEHVILHRDLKLSNILVKTINGRRRFVIADFDHSKRDVTKASEFSGGFAWCWSSPELLAGESYCAKTDVWSAGLVLFRLLTKNQHAVEQRHINGKIQIYGEPKTDLIDQNCSHNYELMRHLIKRMLIVNRDQRISLEEVSAHPLFWSDKKKISFIRDWYAAVEQLPAELPKEGERQLTRKEKTNIRRPTTKQFLHKLPMSEVEEKEEEWSEALKLDDDEFKMCFSDQTDPENKKRHAIYNYAQPNPCLHVPYTFESPLSLLRLIRNLTTHPNKLSKNIINILDKCGKWKFFAKRFPKLFLYLWELVMNGPYDEVKEVRSEYDASTQEALKESATSSHSQTADKDSKQDKNEKHTTGKRRLPSQQPDAQNSESSSGVGDAFLHVFDESSRVPSINNNEDESEDLITGRRTELGNEQSIQSQPEETPLDSEGNDVQIDSCVEELTTDLSPSSAEEEKNQETIPKELNTNDQQDLVASSGIGKRKERRSRQENNSEHVTYENQPEETPLSETNGAQIGNYVEQPTPDLSPSSDKETYNQETISKELYTNDRQALFASSGIGKGKKHPSCPENNSQHVTHENQPGLSRLPSGGGDALVIKDDAPYDDKASDTLLSPDEESSQQESIRHVSHDNNARHSDTLDVADTELRFAGQLRDIGGLRPRSVGETMAPFFSVDLDDAKQQLLDFHAATTPKLPDYEMEPQQKENLFWDVQQRYDFPRSYDREMERSIFRPPPDGQEQLFSEEKRFQADRKLSQPNVLAEQKVYATPYQLRAGKVALSSSRSSQSLELDRDRTLQYEEPVRFEDVFQDKIIPSFNDPKDFKQFARSSFGLGLVERQIKTIEADIPNDVHQRMMDMLWLWRRKTPGATVQRIIAIKDNYIKKMGARGSMDAPSFRSPGPIFDC